MGKLELKSWIAICNGLRNMMACQKLEYLEGDRFECYKPLFKLERNCEFPHIMEKRIG